MSDEIEIQPVKTVQSNGEIRPPGSKSITNRALICAALAEGESELQGALDSEDTQVMIDGLRALGISVERGRFGPDDFRWSAVEVVLPAKAADIFVGNSGTTIRFLTAAVTLAHGEYRLDGVERMRERPIGDLADAFNQLGADVQCEGDGGCPPVRIVASGLQGGVATVGGNISSQFLSGLLMAAPCAKTDVTLRVAGTLVSVPYVTMTLRVMESFGVQVHPTSDYCGDQDTGSGKLSSPPLFHRARCLRGKLLLGRGRRYRWQGNGPGLEQAEPARGCCLRRLPATHGMSGGLSSGCRHGTGQTAQRYRGRYECN